MVQSEIPTDPSELTLSETGGGLMVFDTESSPSQNFMSEVKADVKTKVLSNANEEIYAHIQSLVKQGKCLEITQLERTDATWQSFIYNLPKGTMKGPSESCTNQVTRYLYGSRREPINLF
jgi:hypothetical protein